MSREAILESFDVRLQSRRRGALAGFGGLGLGVDVLLDLSLARRCGAPGLLEKGTGVRDLLGGSCRFEWSCEVEVVWVRVGRRSDDVRVGAVDESLAQESRISDDAKGISPYTRAQHRQRLVQGIVLLYLPAWTRGKG